MEQTKQQLNLTGLSYEQMRQMGINVDKEVTDIAFNEYMRGCKDVSEKYTSLFLRGALIGMVLNLSVRGIKALAKRR